MTRKKELEEKINELELKWHAYHIDSANNEMPDMIELTKLRIELRKIK